MKTLSKMSIFILIPVLLLSTGWVSAAGVGNNIVVYADGKFQNAAGPVRLSGAVNLGLLNSDGLITFDCLFIIDI